MYKITLVPGDGIGPEITRVTREIVDLLGVPIEWEEVPAGEEAMAKYGSPMPEELLSSRSPQPAATARKPARFRIDANGDPVKSSKRPRVACPEEDEVNTNSAEDEQEE